MHIIMVDIEVSTQLFSQAATLMFVGMGFVFAFLGLLIVVIRFFITPLAKKYPDKVADPIIVHPDVRKMLLTQKAFSEGGRAMVYYAGKIIDELDQCDNEQDRKRIDDKLGFFTPILKGFLTEVGFESANHGLQVYGGHGYIKETGLEQIVRDARISTLYEGTTGIQALDLLGRKVLLQRGKSLKAFAKEILGFCKNYGVLSGKTCVDSNCYVLPH